MSRFGFDRYCLGDLSKHPVRAWRLAECGSLYHAKSARDALDAARSDFPYRTLRASDLSEVDMAEVVRSENEQARAQDPSQGRVTR